MIRGEMLGTMLTLMTVGHKGQYDKGGQPYALHPLAVMGILNSTDEELQCIALGHDLLEDTNITPQDLRDAGMTERVIHGIELMTKLQGQSLEEYKEGIFSSLDAMLVKRADLTHNSDIRRLKGVTNKDIARMTKYHTFYLEITQRLNAKGIS